MHSETSPQLHYEAGAPPLSEVCLLIGQLGLGGAEKQLVLLAKGLRARGIGTTVVVMFDTGPRAAALHAAGIPVVHLGFRRRRDGLWRLPDRTVRGFARLVGHLRRTRPQVLHAFLPHGYLTAAPAARLAGVPIMVAGRRGLGTFKDGRPVAAALERVANRWTDMIVANAHAVAADTRARENVPEAKLSVIYNGLSPEAFEPAEPAPIDTGHPVVLCVANLWPYKGHRHLLEAARRLRDTDCPCTLVFAGGGPEAADLEALARTHALDVRFLGRRTDIERLIARSDAVVLPSLQEGMSNAIMEAMAAGRPVVATDVGGTRELLEGRGVLVPPADPAALAAGLRRVLTDRPHAADLARRARAWCRANLGADVMVARHVELYQRLLERDHGPRHRRRQAYPVPPQGRGSPRRQARPARRDGDRTPVERLERPLSVNGGADVRHRRHRLDDRC